MDEIKEIKYRLTKIEERNIRVEAEKRWEVSWARRISVGVLTYFVICVFLYAIGAQNIYLSALVPVVGFVLSTLSLRIIRKVVG